MCVRERGGRCDINLYPKPNKQTKTKKKKFSVWGELGFPVKYLFIFI